MEQEAFFLSHHHSDIEFVKTVAAALTLAGGLPWLDAWEIRPGDSVPSAIEAGLKGYSSFVLFWSESASRSPWVKAEMESALVRWLRADGYKLIPVRLDSTPLPGLLSPVRYIDATDPDPASVVKELLGLETDSDVRRAIQHYLDNSGIEMVSHHALGHYVGCPKCGASPSHLRITETTYKYGPCVVIVCDACGWYEDSDL